jgi:hypothetical protein
LPPYGFDWGKVWSTELGATDVLLSKLEGAQDKKLISQLQKYLLDSAEPPDKLAEKLGIPASDLTDGQKMAALIHRAHVEHCRILDETVAMYRRSYVQAEQQMVDLDRQRQEASLLVQTLTPSPRKANAIRAEAEAQRAILLALLDLRKSRSWLKSNASPALSPNVPLDPFSAKPLRLVSAPQYIEIQSRGKTAAGAFIGYRLLLP